MLELIAFTLARHRKGPDALDVYVRYSIAAIEDAGYSLLKEFEMLKNLYETLLRQSQRYEEAENKIVRRIVFLFSLADEIQAEKIALWLTSMWYWKKEAGSYLLAQLRDRSTWISKENLEVFIRLAAADHCCSLMSELLEFLLAARFRKLIRPGGAFSESILPMIDRVLEAST